MEQVIHINVNYSKTMISIGKQNGYELYRFQDLKKTSSKNYDGGIGAIDVLETSNIVCLTGGGYFPSFQLDNVIIIDDCNEQIRAQIQLPSEVRQLKFFNEFLIAVLDYKIFLLSFFNQIQVLKVINTSLNLKGNFDINVFNNQYQLASINNLFSEKNTIVGCIQILNCKTMAQKSIEVSNSEIYKIKMNDQSDQNNQNKNWIACVSRQQEEIQIFDIITSSQVKMLTSLTFDSSGQFFAILYKQKGKQSFKLQIYTFEYFKKF